MWLKINNKLSGFIAIGLCLKLATLALLGGLMTWQLAQEYHKWKLQPNLKLSAVYHGAQSTWCYDSIPENKKLDFGKFILDDLHQFVTQVTVNEDSIFVTWQATPHNQCQFIFEGYSTIKVKRRRFSQLSTLQGDGGFFRVNDALNMNHLRLDKLMEPESMGNLVKSNDDRTESEPVSRSMLMVSLGIQYDETVSSNKVLSSNEISFLSQLFKAPEKSTTPNLKGDDSTSEFEQTLFKAMYGDPSLERQQLYLEERD
jgi:hypothetical protein